VAHQEEGRARASQKCKNITEEQAIRKRGKKGLRKRGAEEEGLGFRFSV